MKKFYACIRESYKANNAYYAKVFECCETKAEVRELCKQNGYVISGGKVYTEKEWLEG